MYMYVAVSCGEKSSQRSHALFFATTVVAQQFFLTFGR
jgi:hypothetical protein